MSLFSVTLVSLVSLAGVAFLSSSEDRIRRFASALVAFATGALLGDAFIHLIPEALAEERNSLVPSLLCLLGILIFFVAEKLLRHRHHPLHPRHHAEGAARPELAGINIIGDATHNFIDGTLIGASYLASPTLGIATTLAVLFHEIPQELGDFGILVHSGLGVRKAIFFNFLSASTAILGTILTLLAGSVAGAWVTTTLVPIAAGGFVYIASADLIPEMQHDRTLRGSLFQVGLILLGVGIMAILKVME